MSNLDITELLTDRQMDERQTNEKAGTYVAKYGGQGDVSCKKGKRKVQGVPQSQTAALPRNPIGRGNPQI